MSKRNVYLLSMVFVINDYETAVYTRPQRVNASSNGALSSLYSFSLLKSLLNSKHRQSG